MLDLVTHLSDIEIMGIGWEFWLFIQLIYFYNGPLIARWCLTCHVINLVKSLGLQFLILTDAFTNLVRIFFYPGLMCRLI